KGKRTLYNENVRRSERQRLRKEKGRQPTQKTEPRHTSLETIIDKEHHFIDWNKFPDGICVLIDYKPSS
ncbi:5866_t:CDS:1, partial [Paraglomus occultum]